MKKRLPWTAFLIALTMAAGSETQAQPADSPEDAGFDAPTSAFAEQAATTPAEEQAADRVSRALPRHKNSANAPAPAGGAQEYGGWSMARTLGALAGVVGLIMFLAWGYRSMAGGNLALLGRNRRPGLIEIVSRTTLSARQSLCLVRLGSRMVLIGQCPDSLQALDVIDDPETVARLSGGAVRELPQAQDEDKEFQACLDSEARGYLGQGADKEADVNETFTPEQRRIDDVRRSLSETIQRVRRTVTSA